MRIRTTLATLAGLGFIAMVATACGSDVTDPGSEHLPAPVASSHAPSTPKPSKGVGARDASGDVKVGALVLPESEYDIPEVPVDVTNHSSKTSTYFVTVVLNSADGKTRVDDTIVIVNNLASGQTTHEKASFLGAMNKTIPVGSKVIVTEVQRTAS